LEGYTGTGYCLKKTTIKGMKNLRSNPKDQRFFETYINLIKTLKKAGYASQVVSALTEIGGIFAAAYMALLPITPQFAIYFAAIIAVIGTAVIELGLRQLLPHSVDSILYKRFSGLHLPMTILIWVSVLILLAASGVLSFQNSKQIVEQVTPPPAQETTTATDSIYQLQTASAKQQFSIDSAMIAERYKSLIQANTTAYKGQIAAKQREYRNLTKKENRTGNSYATKKDNIKASIAELKAEQATKLAELESARAGELAVLQSDFKAITSEARAERKEGIAEVKEANTIASNERASTVSTYGFGLAYFTVVCLIVLIVSIVLDRIHVKGSEIEETVELSQKDISPPVWRERIEAFRERQYNKALIKIEAYRSKTPPPPAPVAPAKIYDPTKLTGGEIDIQTEDEEHESITIQRRKIGFDTPQNSRDVLGTRNTRKLAHEIEANTSMKTHHKTTNTKQESKELAELKQRLKMYRRRLGQQRKKANEQQKKKGTVNDRTLKAISNNETWVKHYEQLISNFKSN
jgi:hypothetical protein